jgi:DNA-binding SARP family transcriptional activator
MGALTVTTLGSPQVHHADVPCSFPIRKVLALALYLVVTAQSHTRAHLATLLWPEADEALGLLSLRQALLRLRQALGSDAATHLHVAGDLVRLALGDDGAVDVARLSEATAPHAPSDQRLVALHTYQGPFLAHLAIEDAPDFMDWVVAQRAHWDACFDLIAERQMRWLIDEGQVDEASALGDRWMRLRPECESAYRLLATAQATAGNIAGARLTLATVTRHWAELGLEPSAETGNLRAQLESLSVEVTPAAPKRVLRLPLVGRDAAFADLRGAFGRTRDGEPGAALIVGEAGLGKSRLLRTFARWARVQGADVALGRADEMSGRLPYQPLMELLRTRLAREHAPDDLLDDSWLTELQRLVPELHDRYPDLPTPVDDAAAGARLLEAVAQLGLAFARRSPLLWILDDLHWADEATRDALLYLMKRWEDDQAPALVVCSVRSEELATAPALQDWVAAARRATALTEVTLAPLNAELTTQAVATLLGGSASVEICAWLQETTQGNPLYLTHVLQALAERGAVQWQKGEQGDVPQLAADVEVAALAGWLPETLRGVLLRSVKRLDVAAQQSLAAAAVIGTRFDEGLLLQVAGVAEESALSALELAERRLLIRAEVGGYRFAHDMIAEAIYSDLTLARRRTFHRRALQALESRSAAITNAELARHALAAEDWEAAARYSQRTAEQAEQIGARRDAVRHYEQVVRLLTTSPSREALQPPRFTDEARAAVYGALGALYAALGEVGHARAVHEALRAEAQARGARVLEGRALHMQGMLAAIYENNAIAAQRLLEDAQQIAQEQGDTTGLLSIDTQLAYIAFEEEDIQGAGEHLRHMVQLARASGDRRGLAAGLNDISDVFKFRGDWEAAAAACEECLLLFAGLTDEDAVASQRMTSDENLPPRPFIPALSWAAFFPLIAPLARPKQASGNASVRRWAANALMGMGNARLHLGEGDVARAALQMGWGIFTEHHEQRYQQAYLPHKTLGWIEEGEYEYALREARQVKEAMATATGRPGIASDFRPHCALIDAHHTLFHVAEARTSLEQVSAAAPGMRIWKRLLSASRWCAHYALVGDWAAAANAAREAQALRDTMLSPLTWFDFARYCETEALLRAGDRPQAQADVQRLRASLGANRRYRLMYLRMQALLDHDAGEHAAAIAQLVEAVQLANEMGLPGEEWQIAAALTVHYADIGATEHAQEARARAMEGVETLSARISDFALRDHFRQTALLRLPALD